MLLLMMIFYLFKKYVKQSADEHNDCLDTMYTLEVSTMMR